MGYAIGMTYSHAAVRLLIEFEGVRLKPYPDLAGHETIGVGHKLLPGEAIAALTPDECMALLDSDLKIIAGAVSKLLDMLTVTQGEFDALVCFTFNEGPAALAGSTLLEKLKAGDTMGAANEFLEWNKAHRQGRLVEVNGLTRRREAERRMFLAG